MNEKQLIIIAGPTAVGKTALAIQLAKHYKTEIISADSRQCFIELDIGVAKPTPEELQTVKHYFINSHSIQGTVDAAVFADYADAALKKIFSKNDTAIMVGGTGLYIKAFKDGLDQIPAIPEQVRKEISGQYLENGLAWLQDEIKIKDPQFFANGEMKNPQRVMRALEVVYHTGKSIFSFRKNTEKHRGYYVNAFLVNTDRELLYERINTRVDEMIERGLEAEVKKLSPFKHLNALQTVGYKELFDHLDGNISLARAIELIKQNSRHYAKRQITWFKKDPEFIPVAPDVNDVLKKINATQGE